MTGDRAAVHWDAQPFPIDLEDGGVEGITQASRARRDRREHRLDIRGRV